MKIYRKHIALENIEFDVAIDREITAKAFEEFPEFTIHALSSGDQKTDTVAKAIKEKKLLELMSVNDEIEQLVKFALPLMMKKAGETEIDEKIVEIYNIVNESGFIDEFDAKMLEIICLGFTRETAEKKQVKFSII